MQYFENSSLTILEIYPFRINEYDFIFFHSFSDRISFQTIAKSKERLRTLCFRDAPCEDNRLEKNIFQYR